MGQRKKVACDDVKPPPQRDVNNCQLCDVTSLDRDCCIFVELKALAQDNHYRDRTPDPPYLSTPLEGFAHKAKQCNLRLAPFRPSLAAGV